MGSRRRDALHRAGQPAPGQTGPCAVVEAPPRVAPWRHVPHQRVGWGAVQALEPRLPEVSVGVVEARGDDLGRAVEDPWPRRGGGGEMSLSIWVMVLPSTRRSAPRGDDVVVLVVAEEDPASEEDGLGRHGVSLFAADYNT